MKILRIQDSEGFGPYAGRQDICGDLWQEEPHGEASRTPGPMDDHQLRAAWFRLCENRQAEDWKFGFLNGEQLRAWFTKIELKKLVKLGFKVVKIEADEIIASEKQAMWKGII